MIWAAATVIMLVLTGAGLWVWARLERAVFDQPARERPPVASPPPPAPPRGEGYRAAERLDLPPGPEGHQMFAVEAERLLTAYRAHCDAQVHRRF